MRNLEAMNFFTTPRPPHYVWNSYLGFRRNACALDTNTCRCSYATMTSIPARFPATNQIVSRLTGFRLFAFNSYSLSNRVSNSPYFADDGISPSISASKACIVTSNGCGPLLMGPNMNILSVVSHYKRCLLCDILQDLEFQRFLVRIDGVSGNIEHPLRSILTEIDPGFTDITNIAVIV